MADKILNARIQNAAYTESQWSTQDPVLQKGEIAFSSDKGYIFKVGDGTSKWSILSYVPLNFLPLTGGTLTGNLNGKYITGTWLQSTANNASSSAATKICIQDSNGWIYTRTPEQILSDMGITATANELNRLDGITATTTELNYVGGVTSNIQTQLDNKLATTTKYAGSSSIGGAANYAERMKITRVTSAITDIAASTPVDTESIYFCGSDGTTYGCPQNYCIINIKKGNNHRTLLDCYHLQTGDHYINGCMNTSDVTNNPWTGWVLQPNKATIDVINSTLSTINNTLDNSIKSLSVSGKVITYTKNDGTTGTITTQDTTYSVMTGATSSAAGKSGLVPQPTAGKQGQYLRGDGAWATPTDTKNTAGSTNSTEKLFLIGTTSQATNPQTYSNANVYVTSNHLYSNNIQVVNLSDSQALTNKTYNGYTLAAACAKAVTDSTSASAISTGTSLVTERDVYYGLPSINGVHNYTSSTTIYAPIEVGTSGYVLKSSGSGAPTWIAQSSITAGKADTWTTARNFTIKDSDSSHSGTATSVDGSGAVTLLLPSTITASLSGNATTATSAGKWTTARNFTIKDADETNAGTAVSVDGSAAETLLLPSTIKATLTGNASTASKVYGTLTNPTSSTTYYIPFHTNASSENKSMLNNDGLAYNALQGTASAVGYGVIIAGNSTGSGTAGNKQGYIRLYSSSTSYGQITQASTTSALTHTLPATAGTILNTGTTSASRNYTSGLSIGSVTINSSATTFYVPDASDSGRGVVNTAAQTFAGAKTFSGAMSLSSTLSVTGASTFSGQATFKGGIAGNVTGNVTGNLTGTADQSNMLYVYTLGAEDISTGGESYSPIFRTYRGSKGGEYAPINSEEGFVYSIQNGTTSTVGFSCLTLGNYTAEGTTGNKKGQICLFSAGTGGAYLESATTNDRLTHILPAVSGTILNTGTSSKSATYSSGLSIGTVKMNDSTSTYYVPYATASQAGAISTAAQTFAGAKTFNGNISTEGTLSVTSTSTFTGKATFNGGITGTLTGDVTGTADYAKALSQNNTMTYGWNGLNYFNISGTAGNEANTNDTPTTAWWHIIRLNHANSTGYYTDLAIPFNDNSIYYKAIRGGSVANSGWVKVLDLANYTTYLVPKTGGAFTGSITAATSIYSTHSGGENQVGVNFQTGKLYLYGNTSTNTRGIYLSGTNRSGYVIQVTDSLTTFYGNLTGNAATATTATNADQLDGYHGSSSQAVSTYVLRNGSGYVYLNYINSNTTSGENPTVGNIIVTNNSDNAFYRKATPAHVRAAMSAMSAVSANGYYGMGDPSGTTNVWIRTTSQGIIPYASAAKYSGNCSLGTSTWYFKALYCDRLYGALLGTTNGECAKVSDDSNLLGPYKSYGDTVNDNSLLLGYSDKRWKKLWAGTATIGTSDEREKNILGPIDGKYKKLFMLLEPILFIWDRPKDDDPFVHFGLGAQTTERHARECGIKESEIAAIEHSYFPTNPEDGRSDRYGMAYEEIHMLTMAVVQDNVRDIMKHENRITQLEKENELLKQRIFILENK